MMKFNMYIMIGILALALTACGTAEQTEEKATNGTSNPKEEVNTDVETGQEEKTNPSDSMIRLIENNLSFTLNGETKEETAFLKHSDNQGYSMYVLPGYELTAEEPNKDVVMLTSNGEVFMRIELLPEDVDWNATEQSTIEQLKAVATEVKELTPPSNDFFKSSKVFEAKINEELITSYLIKNNEGIIKLTAFTKETLDHRDPFIKMAETIVNEDK